MRDLIMDLDPFFMQLIVWPILVIGLGIGAFLFTKKLIFAPLVTLIVNALMEFWFSKLSSWSIILPLITLFLTGFLHLVLTSYQRVPNEESNNIEVRK
ncbi:hypothetical protein [Salirhabdus sp. Marseille-P4669]|uniref:hypothetical protein n=1 Tax=Salirhabdus sp. Marseille-P4669 TaxID=2042310 RepID=UPI000C7CB86E|nr:hypothetical protein [Salirhabdus sp. Marseille-P4669]